MGPSEVECGQCSDAQGSVIRFQQACSEREDQDGGGLKRAAFAVIAVTGFADPVKQRKQNQAEREGKAGILRAGEKYGSVQRQIEKRL